MAAPVEARLVELRRRQFAWQLVSFAVVSGAVRVDAEFLFAKNFGHSVARWVAGLFPADVDRLRDAAGRRASFTVDDLDVLGEAIEATLRLTAAMRYCRGSQLFRLRRLLFEAGNGRPPRPASASGRPGNPTGPARRSRRSRRPRDPPHLGPLS